MIQFACTLINID